MNFQFFTAALMLSAGSCLASASGITPTLDESVPEALASQQSVSHRALARAIFPSLPYEHQDAIARAGGIGPVATELPIGIGVLSLDAPTAELTFDGIVSDALDSRLSPKHRTMIETMIERVNKGLPVAATCFAPGTDPELMAAIDRILFAQSDGNRFQQTTRWLVTATNGGGLSQGTPTTITYSFPPDGTWCPNIIGVTGSNQLHAWLNAKYGSQAVWQPLFDQVFDRWQELIGTTYVYEPNDDGVNLNQNAGQLGVRGDVRIAAISIDGNFNTLGYNNFPNDGDMVLDAFDSFYNNLNGNSKRLRNVAAHEHGHGLGMLHVCPINETKLMEPTYSGSYDGPQDDDILNGQRHYGDPFENDDTLATANDAGSADVGYFNIISNHSLDDNLDEDFFRLVVNEPLTISLTLLPASGSWLQGQQNGNGSCSSGVMTDYNAQYDLAIDILNAGGGTVVSIDNTGVGSSESASEPLINPGTYYLRVWTTGPTTNKLIQAYDLMVSTSNPPFIGGEISLPSGALTNIAADTAVPFDVSIESNDDSIVGTPDLFYSIDGGAYASSNLAGSEPNFTATLPATDCGSRIDYYISADFDTGGIITLPASGAAASYTASVGDLAVAFDDDFETDTGWTISGSINSTFFGQWMRTVPGSDPGPGAVQSDADGSGNCYVTSDFGGLQIDVDAGDTILTSPVFDASGSATSTIAYNRWFSNDQGANPGEDVMLVEISDDAGSSWTTLETVGPSGASPGWVAQSFMIADFVSPTNQVQVRFTVSDTGGDSDVEAGVDALLVQGVSCDDPCPADLNGDGFLNITDVTLFIDAFISGDPLADLNNDGFLNITDVTMFIDAFIAGC